MDRVLDSAHLRPGFRVVGLGRIGIPVYEIVANLVLRTARDVPLVLEFVLKALAKDLSTQEEVAELLGLDIGRVQQAVLAGIHANFVSARDSHQSISPTLHLTSSGTAALEAGGIARTEQLTYRFLFDGILREPVWLGRARTLSSRQADDLGLCVAAPTEIGRPSLEDLDLRLLTEVLRRSRGRRHRNDTVADIKFIEKIKRRILPVETIVYENEGNGALVGSVLVDQAESPAHEQIIANLGLVDWENVHVEQVSTEFDLSDEVLDAVEAIGIDISPVIAATIEHEQSRHGLKIIQERTGLVSPEEPGVELSEAKTRFAEAEIKRQALPAQLLGVFEHYPLLMESLHTAKEEITIVAPWIKADVVNQSFLEEVKSTLDRGVRIRIAYGFDTRGELTSHPMAVKALEGFKTQYPGFELRYLGAEHSKILIVDDSVAVIGSFNWLSFRGDPDRPKRGETSVKIVHKEFVASVYEYVCPLFAH